MLPAASTSQPRQGKRRQLTRPTTIVKRNGITVDFNSDRILNAIAAAFSDLSIHPTTGVQTLTTRVVNSLAGRARAITVEDVQDAVVAVLRAEGEHDVADHYTQYRVEHERLRNERPIPDDVVAAFQQSATYFDTDIGKVQFADKYARWDEQLGRRETWQETVSRTRRFLEELSQHKLDTSVYDRIEQAILHMEVMPSMRLLAMAGPAAERSHITTYNCSYVPVDSLESFVEALIISMSGCGVGFSVESRYIEQLPRIQRQHDKDAPLFMIADSAEGWAEALRYGLHRWADGLDVTFDYSLIRAYGTPLRTKGGTASGPEPLRRTLDFIRQRMLARQGGLLTPLDCHDLMCMVGMAAVSGGVRRTAMISLFDWGDQEMLHCKDPEQMVGNDQRWNANNSVVWPERDLTQVEITEQFVAMAKGGMGEPGIFSRRAAKATMPAARGAQDVLYGTNPCVTGDTWVMTDQGARQVNDLIGQQTTVLVDGKPYTTSESGFWKTGVKPVLRLKAKEGQSVRLTANHQVLSKEGRWVEAGSLTEGQQIRLHNHRGATWDGEGTFDSGWLLGSLVGDGTFTPGGAAVLSYWGAERLKTAQQALQRIKDEVKTRSDLGIHDQPAYDRAMITSVGLASLAADYGVYARMKEITPLIEQGSASFTAGFLQGFFDADGTVAGTQVKGVSVRLAQSNLPRLEAVQRMLARFGIGATIYTNRRPAGLRKLPDGLGGSALYECNADHELVISRDSLQVFADVIGFGDEAKQERLTARLNGYTRKPYQESFTVTVESITPDGTEAVYDCSVPGPNAFDANGFYAHNCGEILLRPRQFCNLTAAVARAADTMSDLQRKVELATIIGTIQSMATNFPGLSDEWRRNCEAERLLGVDITGQMDSAVARDPKVKIRLRKEAWAINAHYAALLGINPSAAITCVKPSGNSSQLLNCSSGLHTRWASYYIRRMRFGSDSPMYHVLNDAGVPLSPENGQERATATTWVASFPVKAPDGAITRHDVTALQQLEFWLSNKLDYTDHNPSCTITYKPNELLGVIQWVWAHQQVIGGLAFLPSDEHQYKQAPNEEITPAQYAALMETFPKNLEMSKLWRYEQRDQSNASTTLSCEGDKCIVEFVPHG